ncbi:MAG TPA: hypothetical protein VJG64_03745 [Candidatus Paceibacterota bacterium]
MKLKLFSYQRLKERVFDTEEPENFTFIASALWRTILATVVISAFVSITYGFYLLQDVLTVTDVSNTAQKSPSSNPNRVDLEVTVVGFTARKDRYDQLKAQPIVVPDPSR